MKLGNLSFIQNRIWNVYIRGGKKNLKRQTANWWFPDSSLFACLAVCTLYVLVCVMMLNVIVLIRCCWWALTIRNFWFRVTWSVEPHLAALMVSLSCVAFCCRALPYLLFLVLLLDTSKKKLWPWTSRQVEYTLFCMKTIEKQINKNVYSDRPEKWYTAWKCNENWEDCLQHTLNEVGKRQT